MAYSGGSLGAVVTPLIVTPIFLWWGWRAAFWFTGLIGVGVARIVGRRVAAARTSANASAPRRRRDSPVRASRDRRLWAFMCAYALGALPLGFVLYSAVALPGASPRAHPGLIGKVLWIPPLGWEAGYFVWGWIADRALRRGEPRDVSLRRTLTCCVLLNLPFATVPWLPNLAAVMAAMFLAMFVAAGFGRSLRPIHPGARCCPRMRCSRTAISSTRSSCIGVRSTRCRRW